MVPRLPLHCPPRTSPFLLSRRLDWSARDLQTLLGYSQWRRFEQAIEWAITSCEQSGNKPDYHFAGAGKPITGGKDAVQVIDD